MHSTTLRKALRAAGIKRLKPPKRSATVGETVDGKPNRYGYQDRHRRPVEDDRYASSLTDAEWALVQDVFEREGGQSATTCLGRRLLLCGANGVCVADVAERFSALG